MTGIVLAIRNLAGRRFSATARYQSMTPAKRASFQIHRSSKSLIGASLRGTLGWPGGRVHELGCGVSRYAAINAASAEKVTTASAVVTLIAAAAWVVKVS